MDPANAALGETRACLVRTDGYVALAAADARPDRLERYLDGHGLN